MDPIDSLSSLFAPAPEQWGLRGDPFVWAEMANVFRSEKIPETERGLIERIEATFQQITGRKLPTNGVIGEEEIHFVERFSLGGMSSGQVSLSFWHQIAIPLLCSRFRESRRFPTSNGSDY